MDLVIRSFSYERQPRIINYDPTDFHPNPAAEKDFDTPSAILGGFTEPSDPNIHGQYLTEVIVGGEREVMRDVAVGIKGIYRDYGNVIEDFLCQDDGTYCIGNPGKGIMRQVFGLDYTTLYDAPRPVRIYRGVQLDVTKRFSNNWQAIASYIYSKLEGNYDGEYSRVPDTSQPELREARLPNAADVRAARGARQLLGRVPVVVVDRGWTDGVPVKKGCEL